MKIKVSDVIANFLKEKNVRHVFGIIGSGNAHIFDSVYNSNFTEIICVHLEQAACMASQTYYRTCGIVSASLLTTGAGSTNGITGVVSAWADSIPCLIISGNENSKYIRPDNHLRMYGVQGYDSTFMVSKVTKYATRVMEPTMILHELEKSYAMALSGRPGPCWIDVPMNIQSSMVEEESLVRFDSDANAVTQRTANAASPDLRDIQDIAEDLRQARRPVLWLGHGIRLAGGVGLLPQLLEDTQIPTLVSWAGIDMLDSYHPLVFGRAGLYGQRCANFVLQNSDYVLAIGTRLAIPQVGYEINELAREAKIAVVDIDDVELDKYKERYHRRICADAKEFIQDFLETIRKAPLKRKSEWIDRCVKFRKDFPWVDKEHEDKDGFMNSYKFMERLHAFLKEDQIVVTDMGTALLSGHQILRMRPGQRLMTSTGLGEMGYGLPGAIGASVARQKGEVLCLNCDGGMMMNLQELQTIAHHQLPIKIIVFNNDGYLMIKHTQKAVLNGRYSGTNKSSGVSCPNFSKLAAAFGMPSWKIDSWEDFEKIMPQVQACEGPAICEVSMHPEQLFVPKLSLALQKDGTLVSPPLEDLSPFLSREALEENMIIEVHKKSLNIKIDT
jgi:acetolactate synthase-1/2/3 large subunit